jgi:glycine C-acetyltransferase/8-amino-7-oxononanoate synthase
VVAAALAALDIMVAEPRRIERLARNAATLRSALADQGLDVPGGETPIVPVVVGDAGGTVALCERLLRAGVFAQAIRPPTVPDGTSRLRLAAMATHNSTELRRAAGAVAVAFDKVAAPVASEPRARVYDYAA